MPARSNGGCAMQHRRTDEIHAPILALLDSCHRRPKPNFFATSSTFETTGGLPMWRISSDYFYPPGENYGSRREVWWVVDTTYADHLEHCLALLNSCSVCRRAIYPPNTAANDDRDYLHSLAQ